MAEAIIHYAAAIALSALILVIGYRLMRFSPAAYLKSYFFYLLAFCLGYVFSRPIPRLIEWALNMDAAGFRIFSTIVIVFLLEPLTILAFYFLYRFAAGGLERKASPAFQAIYFAVLGPYWLAIAFFSLRALRTEMPDPTEGFFIHSGDLLYVILYLSIYAWMVFGSRRLADPARRMAMQTFGCLAFFGLVFYNIFILAGLMVPWQSLLFLIQILPSLFYLRSYLRKERLKHPLLEIGESPLAALASAYRLTSREMDIIRGIGQGLTNRQIAGRLFLSMQTVKNAVHEIFLKLNVKNRVQLANVFLRATGGSQTGGTQYPIQEKGE